MNRQEPTMSDKVEPWMFGVGPAGVTTETTTRPEPGFALTCDLEALHRAIYAERNDTRWLVRWPSSWTDAGPLWEEMAAVGLCPETTAYPDLTVRAACGPTNTVGVICITPPCHKATEALSRMWLFARLSGWLPKELTP